MINIDQKACFQMYLKTYLVQCFEKMRFQILKKNKKKTTKRSQLCIKLRVMKTQRFDTNLHKNEFYKYLKHY